MTSGEFRSFPIAHISVDRANRTRREVTEDAIHSMAESLKARGQINPIVVTREGLLVAGETRLEAAKHLGWTAIMVQFTDELDSRELLAIELEENIKRTDLPWQDQTAAVKRFHDLQKEIHSDWTQDKTAEALGISKSLVEAKLAVAKELAKGNTRVGEATKFSTARGIVSRANERAAQDQRQLLPETQETQEVIHGDFLQWLPTFSGQGFNFLHCDLPYGINADKHAQGAAKSHGGYNDTPDHYFNLLDSIIDNRGRLLADSGHIFFWFSMKFYCETLARFRKADFWVDEMPFIWHKSDNSGILPWPEMSGRRVYETAFLISWGGRKIIQSTSNLTAFPAGEKQHMSEKPQTMLERFFKMFVDENTRMLDPTCGAGSSLRAAKALGAASVLGLEINEEFFNTARRLMK